MNRDKINSVLHNYDSKYFLWVNDILAFFTLLSVAGIVLETVGSLHKYQNIFLVIEYISVFVFSCEYAIRIWSSDKKLSYIFSFYGIVDLLSIVPSFVGWTNLTFLKSARVLRILRFLRMIRLAKVIRLQKNVKKQDLEEYARLYRLNIQIYFFTLFSAIVIFASLIYIFEPHVDSFVNIPISILWSTKVLLGGTFQTVPQTIVGNIVLIGARFVGLILFGLLISVVGTTIKRFLYSGGDLDILEEEKKIILEIEKVHKKKNL